MIMDGRFESDERLLSLQTQRKRAVETYRFAPHYGELDVSIDYHLLQNVNPRPITEKNKELFLKQTIHERRHLE